MSWRNSTSHKLIWQTFSIVHSVFFSERLSIGQTSFHVYRKRFLIYLYGSFPDIDYSIRYFDLFSESYFDMKFISAVYYLMFLIWYSVVKLFFRLILIATTVIRVRIFFFSVYYDIGSTSSHDDKTYTSDRRFDFNDDTTKTCNVFLSLLSFSSSWLKFTNFNWICSSWESNMIQLRRISFFQYF